MESFFQTQNYLIEDLNNLVDRQLMNEVDWSKRLIAIQGVRGIGKTTFLLQFAKRFSSFDKRDCLYINMNNFLFTNKRLFDFAEEFIFKGGNTLLIDQIFKYPNWAEELRECYDSFENLRIIFTGSTLINLDEIPEINRIVDSYELPGFSFREFLNITTNHNFQAYTLEELLLQHQSIAKEVCSHIKPLVYFRDYIYYGYYPFFLEKRNFSENLLKHVNMMLEIDVLSIKQIEQSYLPKLRKLVYLLSLDAPQKPNISQLSIECGTSRATISNYLDYLKDTQLINLLYRKGDDKTKKPSLVYLDNTNLTFAMSSDSWNDKNIRETFFYSQMNKKNNKVYLAEKRGVFTVEGTQNYIFKIDETKIKSFRKTNVYNIVEMLEIGEGNIIPLWLLGFLY